jgi:S-adenosylmethionine hydrolase
MAIITFMSDFGHRDHYVAAVKAKIFSINPHLNVVDISHSIEQFNIPHAAFVLRSVYNDFPKGTVHLACINSPGIEEENLIALEYDDHYFVGMDSGLFSLLSDEPFVPVAVRLNEQKSLGLFSEKSVLAGVAVALASGISLEDLGIPLAAIRQLRNRQLRLTKHQITGHIIHVDHYGNLITNIHQEAFNTIGGGRPFRLVFGREVVEVISPSYGCSDKGDIVVIFNSSRYLEICLNLGNASDLLGLGYDSIVNISFAQ